MTEDLPTLAKQSFETIEAGGLRWRCLQGGAAGAPLLLMLHGTGSSAHSWAAGLPALQGRWRWLAPDLPGHGGSGALPAAGGGAASNALYGMAQALAALLRRLDAQPTLLVAHSAGAALGLRLWLDGALPALRAALLVNAALLPLPGAARWLFPPAARLMQQLPGFSRLAASAASRPAALQRLVASTGSRLPAPQLAHYRALLQAPAHIEGALAMMAGWDVAPLLPALQARLQRQPLPLRLAAGSADRTVPATQSRQLAVQLPGAEFLLLPGLGHLAHEEDPALLAQLLAGLA